MESVWSINYDIQSLKKCLKNIIQNPQSLGGKTKKRTGNKKLSYMESESASSNRRFKVKEKNKMKQELLKKIEEKSIVVGVVGLGYVGLPLAVEKAKAGFKDHWF